MIDQWYLIFFNLLFVLPQLVTRVLDMGRDGRRAAAEPRSSTGGGQNMEVSPGPRPLRGHPGRTEQEDTVRSLRCGIPIQLFTKQIHWF